LIYHQLKPAVLEATVGVSMVGMSLWMLKPYKLDENDAIHTQKGVFLITLVALLSRTAGIRPLLFGQEIPSRDPVKAHLDVACRAIVL